MYTVTRSLLWDCTLDKQDITRLARQLGDNPAERLAEISPGLFWSWAKLNGYKPQDADPRWDIPFHREAVAALRDCFLRGQRASGLGASIDRKLRRLAESATGRQYLCSQLMR